ncbi:sulfurtransferase [Gudongella sp. SC589]|jgi:thiosulfate/3-mercaptopyruvate sulfurtransferase|uniref:sulfurtransferase n=1 Tax=Gudongella sp. SC589 TaxID=3385990 RepID=UPI003904854E
MKNFVTTDWLKDNLNGENIVVFDVRYQLGNEGYGLEEYKKGHIDGAVFVPMEDILTGEVREHGGRHPLPDLNDFTTNMKNLGVENGKIVVAYDDGELAMAGRLWWMLRYIGKDDVFILKGGISEWKEKGFGLSTKEVEPVKGVALTTRIKDEMIADVEDVRRAMGKDDQIIVDSRTPDRYRGEIEPIDRIPGHIPSAVNYPWTDLVDDIGAVDGEKLTAHYSRLGKYDKILVHCGSGITGTVNIMFMDEIGLQPVLYLGGYSDWISYEENEIVREAEDVE